MASLDLQNRVTTIVESVRELIPLMIDSFPYQFSRLSDVLNALDGLREGFAPAERHPHPLLRHNPFPDFVRGGLRAAPVRENDSDTE